MDEKGSKCRCVRCGYEWVKLHDGHTKKCKGCGSRLWDQAPLRARRCSRCAKVLLGTEKAKKCEECIRIEEGLEPPDFLKVMRGIWAGEPVVESPGSIAMKKLLDTDPKGFKRELSEEEARWRDTLVRLKAAGAEALGQEMDEGSQGVVDLVEEWLVKEGRGEE